MAKRKRPRPPVAEPVEQAETATSDTTAADTTAAEVTSATSLSHEPGPSFVIDVETRTVYTFQSRSRCPRCRTLNTVRVGQTGPKQHRKCRAPICREAYDGIGKPI